MASAPKRLLRGKGLGGGPLIPVMPELADGALPCSFNPEIFAPNTREDYEAAKRYCDTCPIKAACSKQALATKESGVWGGTLYDQGKPLVRPRFRGDPRTKKPAVSKGVKKG